jgi:type I restriction enzyme S subunit
MAVEFPRVLLKDFLEFFNGKSIKAADDGDFPVYGSNGRIGFADEHKYANAIILGRVGAYCGSVEYCPNPFWASDNTIVVKPKAEVAEIRFLSYLLRDLDLNRHAGGAAQPLLTQTTLKQVEAPLPPLPTQRKIASILSAYDDLIENNTRRIAILEEMAQSIYREWFVNFRFPGHENVKLVDSPLGMIPEGWEVVRVKSLLKRLKASRQYKQADVTEEGTVPVIDQSTVELLGFHDNEPDFEASSTTPFVIFGDHTCKMELMTTPFSIGPNVVPFVSKTDHPVGFVYYVVKSLVSTQEYKRHWTTLNNKEICPGPAVLANQFVEMISPMVEAVALFRIKNRNLRTTRDLLLPKLISGKLDVEDLDIDVGEPLEELEEATA